MTRAKSAPGSRTRGAAYLEALLVLGPLLTLILGITQLVLLQAASLVVQHAATRSVRSAVVVLEDDPKYFRGAPRGSVDYRGAERRQGVSGPSEVLAKARAAQQQLGDRGLGPLGSGQAGAEATSRLGLIRQAAKVPLATLTPPLTALAGATPGLSSLARELEESGGLAARFLAGLTAITGSLTAITLREGPGSEQVIASLQPDALVTVHVGYVYRCNVPIARRLLCRAGRRWLTGWDTAVARVGQALESAGPARLGRLRSHESLSEKDRRFEQTARYVESPSILKLMLASGGHYQLLEAEASLPNQGARYYASQ